MIGRGGLLGVANSALEELVKSTIRGYLESDEGRRLVLEIVRGGDGHGPAPEPPTVRSKVHSPDELGPPVDPAKPRPKIKEAA